MSFLINIIEKARWIKTERKTNMKTLANEIVAWLKDYAVKNNRKSFVLGVSGGVDSALVSTLCAMTGIKTICVQMPCQSTPNEGNRAEKHIQWLQEKYPNVKGMRQSLTSTFETFRNSLPYNLWNDLAFANTKSRLRMIMLYQIATVYEGLVVGTGNKVEDFGVFFYTKYGDGGVDISPIANLMKSEVRAMCEALGVLPELTNAVPTDGLWGDTRTDESALGASYDELEWAMNFIQNNIDWNILSVTPRQREVLAIYHQRHQTGLHKSLPIPTFIRKT